MATVENPHSDNYEFSELEVAGVEPLTLDDIAFRNNDMVNEDFSFDPTKHGRLFLLTKPTISKKKKSKLKSFSSGKDNWRKALKLIQARGDPWKKFHLDRIESEQGRRHRYNSTTQDWVVDECIVKMDKESFAHGARRECFRMKKLSNFSMSDDWARDSNNFVAKSYIFNSDRETYFEDVKLQMDAKLWGEEYNRHNPPKKVDIFMMGVLEMDERADGALYHIENYIEGDYVKYNSNSGFVAEKSGHCRKTPQAFSHFTFERSGHQLVVVDIQGVGDLYTDPQIHTITGQDYGDGNLGTRGMALFFHSHHCNDICNSLGLTPFDLSTTEFKQLTNTNTNSETKVKCEDTFGMETLSFTDRVENERFSSRDISNYFSKQSPGKVIEDNVSVMSFNNTEIKQERTDCVPNRESPDLQNEIHPRLDAVSRPSSISGELAMKRSGMIQMNEDSVLGLIHLDLAVYHETCRFDADIHDTNSAHFHLKAAADCGNQAALVAISCLYLGLPNDILPGLSQSDVSELSSENIEEIGLDYLDAAALNGDITSILFLAKAFDSGWNLGTIRRQCYEIAMEWYQMALDEGVEKSYLIWARMAEIMMMDDSGCRDPQKAGELYQEAAEAAMEKMCGKLADRYFRLTEEAWVMLEE